MQTRHDIGTLTIGGGSFLAIAEDVQWASEGEFDDFQSIDRWRQASQRMKKSATMTVPTRPIKTGNTRLSHFDLSAITLASLDILPELVSATLRVGNPVNTVPNIGEYARRYQADPGGTISADLNLEVADSASNALALLLLLESDDPADTEAILSLTLNAAAFTLPGHIRSGNHNAPGRQTVSIAFEGADPGGATAYPTAPVGTTTMFERALNAPRTPLAFTYVSKLVDGLSRTGNCLIESAEMTIEDARMTRESYSFRVTGDWTTALTEA